jgi:uroporphyrinogen-III synthase
MTHPLAGKRIVVTRFEIERGPLTTALLREGAEPIVTPLIGINPVVDDDATAKRPLREFDWIAFTSANGVRMFWARLNASERLTFITHRGIAAVGPATAQAVAALGATSAITAPEFVAESLADALGDVRDRFILWPRAAGARSMLSERLRERGAEVVESVLYDTVQLPVAEEVRQSVLNADAITFTSPSAVRAFVSSFGIDVRPQIVCIGPVTEAAARDAGLRVNAVAAIFTMEGMVAALSDLFTNAAKPVPVPTPASRLH